MGMGFAPTWLRQVSPLLQMTTLPTGFGLAGLMSCCETLSCHAHRHNDVKGHSNISSTIYSFLFCAWDITLENLENYDLSNFCTVFR